MPEVTVTLRARMNISEQRQRLLELGDVSEFDMMRDDLQERLKAQGVVIDDVEDALPTALRVVCRNRS